MNVSLHKLFPLGIIFISAFLFAAVLTWGIFPFQDKIVEKANTIEADHALQANRENRVKELPQLEEQYDLILQNEGTIDTLVSHGLVVPFIENIESLAYDNDVEISITNQDQLAAKKKPVVITEGGSGAPSGEKKKKDESILGNMPLDMYMSLRFDVRGEYVKVAQFLYQFESLPYAVDVVAVDIRQWQPSDTRTSGDAFAVGSPGSVTVDPAGKPAVKNLVQGFFDIVVYTKD